MRGTLGKGALPIVIIVAAFALVITSGDGLFASPSSSYPLHSPGSAGTIVTLPLQSSGCNKPAPFMPGSSANAFMTSGGLTRMYRLHLPPSYRGSAGQALIVSFHGHGSNALEQERRTSFSTLADRGGFIVVYPQGVIGPDHLTGWATGPLRDPQVNDILFVSDLLTHLQGMLCIDPYHIYATGFSNGGGMTNLLACRLADRIAAFALVSGSYPPVSGGCHPRRPVPILEFHGTADRIVPYTGSISNGYPPIATWLRRWATLDGCARGPTTFFKTRQVTGEEWTGQQADAVVIHYRMQGETHMWPRLVFRAHLDATSLIWSFFEAHPLPPLAGRAS